MRITAGTHRGKNLKVPDGVAVRPTSDKVRQAIFNILKAYELPMEAHVLDGFAGSGALGLEALSRGAVHATFIEKDKTHYDFVKANAAAMKVTELCRFQQKDVTKIGAKPEAAQAVQLVFLDPPYRLNLIAPALDALAQGGWLAEKAVLVCEHERGVSLTLPSGFTLLDQRRYGETEVSFLQYLA